MVRATFAGFDTALSSLRMNQKQLDIVGQNLANMNTTGYTRQALRTSSNNYENPSSFYMNENDVNVGFGVSMDEVYQLRNQFLDKQYRTQNGKASYNDSVSDSLKTLSSFLDETSIDGIRSSLDDITTALTNMQDPSKVQDPVYSGQLLSKLQAFTTLMNSASESITNAERDEYRKIDGTGTSEQGAVEKINELLGKIGELNSKIKHNQLLGNPALELQDERNNALDELSGYIPIEVETFSESYTVTNKAGNAETRYRIYNYDENGRITGRSDWPEDVRVRLAYTDYSQGSDKATTKYLTLVEGSAGYNTKNADGLPSNIGKVELPTTKAADGTVTPKFSVDNPLDLSLTFTASATTAAANGNPDSMSTDTKNTRFESGSVQASLDMLSISKLDQLDGKTGYDNADLKASNQMNYYSYDYYMDKLNILAKHFAEDMNTLNFQGNTTYDGTTPKNYLLLVNKDVTGKDDDGMTRTIDAANTAADGTRIINVTTTNPTNTITAANISVSKGFVNSSTVIGLHGFVGGVSKTDQGDTTDTVTEMLKYMKTARMVVNNTKTSYADYMNNVSTTLASDAYNNDTAYKINNTVKSSIDTSRDQLSGVSLDEEAANMMTYTSSYNAAARLMTTLDDVLQTLLGIAS